MDVLRTFECHLAGNDQRVEIADVLVRDGVLHLIVSNSRSEKWVLEIIPKGVRVSRPELSRELLATHEEEKLRFLSGANSG